MNVSGGFGRWGLWRRGTGGGPGAGELYPAALGGIGVVVLLPSAAASAKGAEIEASGLAILVDDG
ncbi:MAG: hypothetical protein KJ749_02020 [Planctomycetes bacterium]|nr:hypothetical protein [Planctomycetota bacterium]